MVLREGPVRQEIENILVEREADHLVLGAPKGSTANIFGDDEIERFAEDLARRTGVKAHVVWPEKLQVATASSTPSSAPG
jgi:RNase H-fold protein (predicted Holliday junction resolvase)